MEQDIEEKGKGKEQEQELDFTHLSFPEPIPVEEFNDPAGINRSPDDELPSCGGHGTLEILQVTELLRGAGIICCLVGISALIYYGAGRVRKVS